MVYKSGTWGKEAKERSERRKRYFAEYQKRWRDENYDLWLPRHQARRALFNAVRAGKVIKLPCMVCGNKKSQGHHDDYSKPLDVIWLCKRHHLRLHRELKALGV